MLRLRSFPMLTLVLSLLLALTSQTLAQARGQVRSGDAVVLCSGGGAVTVTLDADGNPTGPAHICPDMALWLLAGPDLAPPAVPARMAFRAERAISRNAAAPVPTVLPVGEPRGPPPVV